MFYYIGILFFCFLSSMLSIKVSKRYQQAFFIFLCLFLCFGYMTGTDWRTYEKLYESVYEYPIITMVYTEPGYVLYNYIFGILGVGFWPFFIFTKIVIYCVFIKTLRYYCPEKTIFLTLLFFISWYAYFMFIDNPMRNLIAVGIFCLAQPALRERKLFKYIGWTFLAVSFHTSAMMMLVFYYFANKSYSTRNIIIFYILLNILLLNSHFIFSILEILFARIPLLANKIEAYSTDNIDGRGKIISFGMLVHNLFFILLILSRKIIENIQNGKMIFTFSILLLILFRLGLTITVLGRFQLYLSFFYTVSIGVMIYKFTPRTRILYAFFVLLVSVVPCISYLTKDYRYIPYTNYLFYLNEDLSYDERDNYNKDNSPYVPNK